jgi:hypothetical protein
MRSFRIHSSRPSPGSRLAAHVRADRPDRSSFALCSPPSTHGLAMAELAAPTTRRLALTAAARGAPTELRSGRRNPSVEQRNVITSIAVCVARGVRGTPIYLLTAGGPYKDEVNRYDSNHGNGRLARPDEGRRMRAKFLSVVRHPSSVVCLENCPALRNRQR